MSQVILYGRFSADPLWPDLGDPQGSLLLLLYGTGMRLGEALRLSLGDVVLSDGLIAIRGSKFWLYSRMCG
jgi:hypothetical protein